MRRKANEKKINSSFVGYGHGVGDCSVQQQRR